MRCLQTREAPEAMEAEARFQMVWSKADLKIASTCLCIPGKKTAGG